MSASTTAGTPPGSPPVTGAARPPGQNTNGGASSDAGDPPFAPAILEDALKALSKTVRTRQLYLPNNPVYQRSIQGLAAGFQRLWQETDDVILTVSEADFRWEGLVVGHESSKADSLPWMLYKDGVREITLTRGVEAEEIVALLDILQRVRKASPDEDDLLTLLWEQEFLYFRYRFVDMSLDSADEPAPGASTANPSPIPPPAELEDNEASRRNIVRMEDFDSALYFLDETEIEYLRRELLEEYQGNRRRNVIAIFLDIFELQPSARADVCDFLEYMILHLLSAGELGAVAYMLREAREIANGKRELNAEHRDRLLHLSDRLSEPATLTQLLRALGEAADMPPEDDIVALFGQLRDGSLGTVLAWLATLENVKLRSSMETVVASLAAASVSELVKLTLSADPDIARQAIRLVGAMKTTAAVGALGKLMGAESIETRHAAVQALSEIGSPGALRLLEKGLDDGDRDIRMTAIRALATKKHQPAFARLDALVRGKNWKGADLSEKMAVFEAYGALGAEAAMPHLDSLLNGKGFLGKRSDSEVRACAAMALGRIGSERALTALRQAQADKDFFVRNAVTKALRGGGTA
ncbi:MAG: HEAT repeat domain-containing protein [Gemmatimonadaceae bacterium]